MLCALFKLLRFSKAFTDVTHFHYEHSTITTVGVTSFVVPRVTTYSSLSLVLVGPAHKDSYVWAEVNRCNVQPASEVRKGLSFWQTCTDMGLVTREN